MLKNGPVQKSCWIILLLLGAAYWPLTRAAYSNYDDVVFVLTNPLVFDHSVSGFIRIFSTPNSSHDVYVPLTVLSFNIEHMLFGLHPLISHAINFLLHGLNVALVAMIGLGLGLSGAAAALGAVFFAIHPLHAEPVAWVTSRKDVLYGAFYLLSLLCYVRYVKTGSGRCYGLALGCAALSVLAKPMALSLPFVFFLVDWFAGRKWSARLWLDKIPFLFVVEPVAYVTYLQNSRSIPLHFPDSILIWCWSAAFYIRKFFWPAALSPFYTLPFPLAEHLGIYIKSVGVVLGGVAVMVAFRAFRWIVFGGMFYVLSAIFLWRFDNYDPAVVADRFMYIPSLGLCLMCGWAMAMAVEKVAPWRWLAKGLIGILLLVMVAMTHAQSAVWTNCWTLWSRAIEHEPLNQIALVSRARCVGDPELFPGCRNDFVQDVIRDQQKAREGVPAPDVRQSLDELRLYRMLSDLAQVRDRAERQKLSYNAALILKEIGVTKADEMIASAVRVNPWVPTNLKRRGLSALWRQENALARKYAALALDIDPKDAGALAIRAGADQMNGRTKEARWDICLALRIHPQDPTVLEVVRRLFSDDLRCEEHPGQP